MPFFSDLLFEARSLAQTFAESLGTPVIRLGVTGLSRAGKTVFITALIQHLTELGKPGARNGRSALPVFRVLAEGRLTKGRLEPQPDDAVPRFAYEDHRAALNGGDDGASRHWPESTRRISEVRVRLEFERAEGLRAGPAALIIDIVDYPGEWLLDLPLLDKSYADWSRETLEASASAARASLAADWRGFTIDTEAGASAEEDKARKAAELFTAYLKSCRADSFALSTLPPGRFLMPGDLEGSPALTFAPLKLDPAKYYGSDTLAGMMERRYEAYKSHVVRPFFRDHFARLDRQIVLVDTLAALNAGPAAVRDLEMALADILNAFRAGRNSVLSAIFKPRIDKILFAATKADHLNHTSHDRLEAILRTIVGRAIARADDAGATIDVIALAGVRATREARIGKGAEALDSVVGIPAKGEVIDGETFDGNAEAAVFPGDLPTDPKAALRGEAYYPAGAADMRFVRFRPPRAARDDDGLMQPLPHIRLDRALQFLLGRQVGMSDMSEERRRPRAVRLKPEPLPGFDEMQPGTARPERRGPPVEILPDPAAFAGLEMEPEERAVEVAQKRGIFRRTLFSWGGLFWSALGALVSLALGLWVDRLIEEAFARAPTLGWVGLALVGLLLLALLVLGAREMWAIGRQRHIARLHQDFAQAHAKDDQAAARKLVADLASIYEARPDTARARGDLLALRGEIVDGRDLCDIAERTLVAPLDDKAKHAVAGAAKRVSVVTTVAPRAIIDVAFVLMQAVRLIRQIAEIYGGRPGLLGLLKLARSVGAHLAITGGMAAGDSLLQQVVGHGIAAKISARLGEGVLNGLLTARIGVSAMAVCRPMPFAAEKTPNLRKVVPFLFRSEKDAS